MCDWSVTADIRQKNQYGTYGEYMGGCCHDEVAKHFPELAKFISLHLCNHYEEEFDDFVNKVDRSQLPEDIRFELK